MKDWKTWPHLAFFAVLCAVLAGTGVALWMKHEQKVEAQTMPSVARIERVDGDVALNNGVANNEESSGAEWINATPNQPFSVGDRIYTRQNSHASLAFTGRNFARLYPNTSLDVLSLNQRQTQVALRDGSAMFDIGYLAPGELFEVATPYGAVDLNQPGLYDVGFDNGNVIVSVLSGLAQVVGLGGSGQIGKGEMLRLLGQTAADVVLSRLNGRDAGYLVNDYYAYQYPQYYDGRYQDYSTYLNDPYYFDPYRRNVSYQYVSSYIPGLNDLDYYGAWQNVSGYGNCWRPRVDSGWAPYEQGYWMNDYPYGPTWVSTEPWGYAPYHYGRWAYVGNQWYWVPDSAAAPSYSPALVAFVPVDQDDIGWLPLGPGDAYAPRYYNSSWQPSYLTRTDIVQPHLVNLYVPGAVEVLPVEDFARGVSSNRARKVDRQMLSQLRPVLDPLTLTPLRNAVLHSAWGRGKQDLPPGIAKKLRDTTVITSSAPIAPFFHRDVARSMRVEAVPDKARNQRFKVRDERNPAVVGDQGQRQLAKPAQEARDKGNPGRQFTPVDQTPRNQRNQRAEQSARRQIQAERAPTTGRQQPQAERVGRPARQEVRPEVMRPPTPSVGPRAPGVTRERGNIREARPTSPAPPSQRRQPESKAIQRQGPPASGQGHGQQKAERKPDRPQSAPQSQGGGKGKGKKP